MKDFHPGLLPKSWQASMNQQVVDMKRQLVEAHHGTL